MMSGRVWTGLSSVGGTVTVFTVLSSFSEVGSTCRLPKFPVVITLLSGARASLVITSVLKVSLNSTVMLPGLIDIISTSFNSELPEYALSICCFIIVARSLNFRLILSPKLLSQSSSKRISSEKTVFLLPLTSASVVGFEVAFEDVLLELLLSLGVGVVVELGVGVVVETSFSQRSPLYPFTQLQE